MNEELTALGHRRIIVTDTETPSPAKWSETALLMRLLVLGPTKDVRMITRKCIQMWLATKDYGSVTQVTMGKEAQAHQLRNHSELKQHIKGRCWHEFDLQRTFNENPYLTPQYLAIDTKW